MGPGGATGRACDEHPKQADGDREGPPSDPQAERAPTHVELLAELERVLRLRHYAGSTQRSYVGWSRRFLQYVGRSGAHVPTGDDLQAFLSHLAVQGRVSASTQNQAFHAVLFLICRAERPAHRVNDADS